MFFRGIFKQIYYGHSAIMSFVSFQRSILKTQKFRDGKNLYLQMRHLRPQGLNDLPKVIQQIIGDHQENLGHCFSSKINQEASLAKVSQYST